MIHNNSADPVLIKKIHLQIWFLRDEIESVITNSLTGDPEEVKKTIALLRNEYSGTEGSAEEDEGDTPDNVLDLPVPGNEEEEASAEEGEEEASAEEGEDASEENTEEENSEAPEVEAAEGEETNEGTAEGTSEEGSEDQVEASAEQQSDVEEVPFEEGTAPVKTYTLNDYLPEANSDGEAVGQRRPNLEPGQMLKAMCFLSELNMDAIYFFCNDKMLAGQSVVIDFLVPNRFLVMAEIINCRPYNMRSRIISATPHPYRVAARPLFIKTGERTLLREFLETVEPDLDAIAAQQKAKKPVKKKEEEDDIDDLDDLDL
jgi:hypothetical protein